MGSREVTPPFKDNEFDIVIADNVLEHIYNPLPLIEELHRITKKGGKIKVFTPYFSSHSAFVTLEHAHFFGLGSFYMYEPESKVKYMANVRFRVKEKLIFSKRRLKFLNPIFNSILNSIGPFYQRFLAWILPCDEIRYELEVIKG